MKTLAKYHACNRCVIGKKKNILKFFIGPGKLPGLSRNGSQARKRFYVDCTMFRNRD